MSKLARPLVMSEVTQSKPTQGTLLGVVLDLSGSMQTNLKNDVGGQYSRIESLSKAFQRATENIEKLVENISTVKSVQFRLFSYGFGFCVIEQPICDILAALKLLKTKMTRYKSLHSELKKAWLLEVEHLIEEKRMPGDAKEQLRLFLEQELRDRAIEAEQKRNAAKFQHLCESIFLQLDNYEIKLRALLMHSKYLALILTPFVVGLLWLLRGPTLVVSHLNKYFEAWVQKKLTEIRTNANKYSIILADKAVTETKMALDAHQHEIREIIIRDMTNAIDRQCFKLIGLYDSGSTKKERKEALEWDVLKAIYEEVAEKIGEIIQPQTNLAWHKNKFIFKQAAGLLKVKPNWDLLRIRTLQCAYQAVWNMTEPFVQQVAEDLAKQRFIKAVLATTVLSAKDKELTLPIQDLTEQVKGYKEAKLSIDELPIYGGSLMGQALKQTFDRFQREMKKPQNKGLRPVLLIVSDGEVIDQVDPLPITENLKRLGVIVICCFLTNKNLRRPWVLRRRSWWFWPRDAKLMFSMASSVDDWPEFGEHLRDSRFLVKKHAKLFVQINHSEYLGNFIEAVLLPLEKEYRFIKSQENAQRENLYEC